MILALVCVLLRLHRARLERRIGPNRVIGAFEALR
jgi:hypothetical protein